MPNKSLIRDMKLTKAKLISFLKEEFKPETVGEDFNSNIVVLSGKEGAKYSEYSKGKFYVSFEESVLYDLLNFFAGNDKVSGEFIDRFNNFLDENGAWYEMGNAWNLNVGEKES